MKNNKDINTTEVNELILTSKKILKLVYIFLFFALIMGAIYILNSLNILNVIRTILGVLSPLIIGFIIAWLFSPLVNKLYSKGLNRLLGTSIIFVGIILFIIVFTSLFIPIIIDQVNELITMIPGIADTLIETFDNVFNSISENGIDVESTKNNVISYIEDFGNNLVTTLPGDVLGIAGSLFSGLLTGILSLIIGFYMLVDFDNIKATFIKLAPKKIKQSTSEILTDMSNEVRKTVNGILLIATMVFVCDTVGFAIVGLDAALLIGLLCGITDLIPYIGPYIGGGIAVLVGYSQGPVVGTGVLIIAVIVQLLENYVMQPVVMSKATALHPTIIMASLLIFGYFFGIVGMILSTPILAVLKVSFKHLNDKLEIFDLS